MKYFLSNINNWFFYIKSHNKININLRIFYLIFTIACNSSKKQNDADITSKAKSINNKIIEPGSIQDESKIKKLNFNDISSESKIIEFKNTLSFEDRFKKNDLIKDKDENSMSLNKFRELFKSSSNSENIVFKIGNTFYKKINFIGNGTFFDVYGISPVKSEEEYYVLKVPRKILSVNKLITQNRFIENECNFYKKLHKIRGMKLCLKSELLELEEIKNNKQLSKSFLIVKEYTKGKTVFEIIEETDRNTQKLMASLLSVLEFVCELSNLKIINIDPNFRNFVYSEKNCRKIKLIDGWEVVRNFSVLKTFKLNIGALINMTNLKANSNKRGLKENCKIKDRLFYIFSDIYYNFFGKVMKWKHLAKISKKAEEVLNGFWDTIDYIFCNTLEFVKKNENTEVIDFDKIKILYLENVKKYSVIK